MSLQDLRDEIAVALDSIGWNAYSTTPGAAELPAVVVGLPNTIDPTATAGYWRLELPVFIVLPNATPEDSERELLERLPVLSANLKALTVGGRAVRVVDIDSFYDVTVGTTSAISAAVNIEIYTPNPT